MEFLKNEQKQNIVPCYLWLAIGPLVAKISHHMVQNLYSER